MFNIQKNILLAPYTTFRIGGPAKYFAEAESVEEIEKLCEWAKNQPTGELPIFVLGGGSNVLVSDKGFCGLVIKIKSSEIKILDSEIYADAGASLTKVVIESAKAGLSGFEWGIGIPGTIGGAVCGNAGAFGKATSDAVKTIKALDLKNGKVLYFSKNECDFCYRDSMFKNNSDFFILGAIFSLKRKNKDSIDKDMKQYVKERSEAHVKGCSAGCFFKNVEWKRKDLDKDKIFQKFPELKKYSEMPKIPAGFLIDSVGLKGKKIGGAKIAEEHANFIVNEENATADEVMMLAGMVKDRISSKYGFSLEEETVLVGFD
ncbi:MAG: UDP-N-acetylmuramate dehydrogenase [Candidatus Pacebacteria bacterium]|nr:UDP-N-acetylmuramate dehydrogenase [Candidatus Paceibacterota bacterium]